MFKNKSVLVRSSVVPTWSRCRGVFRSLALQGRGRSSTPVLLHLHLLHTDKTPQNPESIKPFPPAFSVLMHLAFPFCAISVFLSVSSGSFPKNYYLITDYNFRYFVFFSVKMSVLRFPKTLLPRILNIRHVILPCIVIIFRAEVSAGALWCCLLLPNVLQCP